MYSRGALTAVPEAESGQSSPVGASNHLGALSRDNIRCECLTGEQRIMVKPELYSFSSARLHKKQSFKSRMEKRPVVEPKLAKLHEVLEHLREVYRWVSSTLFPSIKLCMTGDAYC